MVKPTSFILKLKIALSDAVAEYKGAVTTDDKQATATLEHFASLIGQIPSSPDMITSDKENVLGVIKKLWIYADSIETGYFNNPKKILIERIKKILKMPEYSLESIFKEYTRYVADFNIINTELNRIISQLENKEIEMLEVKAQKDESERWMFVIEQKYAVTLKAQEEHKLKMNSLQEQLDKRNAEITKYCKEIIDNNQLIEKLKSDKKVKHLKQKELAKKIKEITNKINFGNEVTGVAMQHKSDSLKESNMGLETLEKTLEKLQEEKDKLLKNMQLLTCDIEKEITEKKTLKDNLHKVEKMKEELERSKTQFQMELEQFKKHSEGLRMDLIKIQTNLNGLQEQYQEAIEQKNVLEVIHVETQVKLQEEIDNKKILEVKNEVLLGENADKEKSIMLTKEHGEKLKLKLESHEKNFKEQLNNQIGKLEKELGQTKKSYHSKEQSLRQQLQILEKQNKNLNSKTSILEEQNIIYINEGKLLKEGMEAKNTSSELLRMENETLKKELTEIKPRMDAITRQKEELLNKNNQLKSQIDEIEEEKAQLKIQKENLTERLKMLQNVSPPPSPQKISSGKFPFFNKKDNANSESLTTSAIPRLDRRIQEN